MHTTLHDTGITNLVGAARRGDYTIPSELAEAYGDLETFVTEKRPRYDELAARAGDVFRVFNRTGGARSIITNHLQPAFNTFLAGFRADVELLGAYVQDITVPLPMLSESDEMRAAYIRFVSSHPPYATIRAAWAAMRKMDGHSSEPLGADSPLAEVRNMPDLVADWEACHHGRTQWPWGVNVHHIKLAWLVNNGGHLWLPTAEEQSANWGRRGASKAA